ncbi:hypothetical protein CONLIGDRAFT_638297 [Coniochaeta ligniaria NRRL 30616]|uniref:Uncharacterized protein n=1 Tax=Coniochaeta ligniaria NRRL 30616 TaxID=1408157 RepID=A0A1J7IN25_9PEZI|nr:hypothetical protein CONLIGDRAFT_638297 [Coniochaeta ligniaria NRRL 30616]
MYPWHSVLNTWAASTGLHVDALGLVTILGSEEVNNSVGRLVSGSYVEFLPLLGAFMLASDRFTEKRPGFTLYNFSAGMQTSELAGWFSRWLKAQEFSQIRDIVTWKVEKCPRRRRWQSFLVRFLLIGLPINGMLVALTVLSEDWWGFANAVAMILSVLVRVFLVSQRQAGIDETIRKAREEAVEEYLRDKATYGEDRKLGKPSPKQEAPMHPDENIAKVIVIMDDSKVVTIKAPGYLIGKVFTKNPPIPNRRLYQFFQAVGWLGFGSHIITLGMAGLHTQIYTAALLILGTILSVYKVGCDDWRLRQRSRITSLPTPHCWISNSLVASCSEYPDHYANWSTLPGASAQTWTTASTNTGLDPEKAIPPDTRRNRTVRSERRQDLFAWLEPNSVELMLMNDWYLVPHRNRSWMKDFEAKVEEHKRRLEDPDDGDDGQ